LTLCKVHSKANISFNSNHEPIMYPFHSFLLDASVVRQCCDTITCPWNPQRRSLMHASSHTKVQMLVLYLTSHLSAFDFDAFCRSVILQFSRLVLSILRICSSSSSPEEVLHFSDCTSPTALVCLLVVSIIELAGLG